MNLFTLASGLLLPALIGLAKQYTPIADTAIWKVLKPVQPVVAASAAVALPLLAQHFGITAPDPQVFTAAPTATIAGIAIAEIGSLLQKKAAKNV